MTMDPAALVELADGFALTPGLAPLREFWEHDELLVLHAMAIPFRTRSYFDGQAILETGLDQPEGSADGWLNRLPSIMDGARAGIAVAAGMPRSLSGPFEVASWSPTELGVVEDAYLERLSLLYRSDEALQGRFEAALGMLDVGEEMEVMGDAPRRPGADAISLFEAAARLMAVPGGPNVAAMEFSGLGHAREPGRGTGQPRSMGGGRLADGLTAFREAMGVLLPTLRLCGFFHNRLRGAL
ncbi:MAG: hypothetical protein WD995_10120 [Gemmatimonadota bacterium]